MSPICVLTQVPESTIQLLLKSPKLLPVFLRRSLPCQHVKQERQNWLRGSFSRQPKELTPLEQSIEASSTHVSLDKSWHGLHYLLAGNSGGGHMPDGFLLSGGTVVEDDEAAKSGGAVAWQQLISGGAALDELHSRLGPARAFSIAQVQSIHSYLASNAWPELRHRYQPETMQKLRLYPQFWVEDQNEVGPLLYLQRHFSRLQQFVGHAAESKAGMLIHFVSAVVF
ncbi:DUF1877 family protein [Anatilimnocola sp. NA78]|uniref:DUF1877 family protein n=1 Tax=Anatilimnocola sp. NA78 TaxID=3415683 RepID=UPI003CE54B92